MDSPTEKPTEFLGGGDSLLLASSSRARAALLRNAGLAFRIEVPGVDEDALKQSMRTAGAHPDDAAVALAELKAQRLSRRHPTAYVIGADQMLSCGTEWYDKPASRADAEAQLRALRGRQHRLHSAVCVARGGDVLWRHVEQARLTMRDFTDDFIARYLVLAGEAVTHSVGAYQLEGAGAQLFARVEGDYFAILGLPLLPLLAFLREHQVVPR